ncbi:hypothetical protein GCM10011529_13130 [Polymorphobacter glacialis]|uniref:Ice-binding protein C-terminal domain-containing protein n=1 Tax=Sandarakinorhabdus glacialis TaxID=1614636 RepID=A0A917E6K1_9SPHN|nr:PEPxxWA-CTERM sorting domain-containing protein [Polymorphobacter glacialis]GGE08093.1 hypothetical protein GCM10011529_13130 [Polymorphobacter glacialis]
MTYALSSVVTLAVAGTLFAAPAAATVGSASLATMRNCNLVSAAQLCDGTGPGQQIAARVYGGGVGVGGQTKLVQPGNNRAWSEVRFDGSLDLPEIRAYTLASGNVRMNINSFAFQSYTWNGSAPGLFSLTGSLHIVNSSTSPAEGSLPNGARYTQYVGIWDPSVIAGLSTPQQLFDVLFYRRCSSGVLGVGNVGGTLAGGEATFTTTTSACSPGSLFLNPGQQVLVVAGLQLPVNRGGFADSSATFITRLGDDLSVDEKAALTTSLASAVSQGAFVAGVPEPASWAMLIAGFGLVGAAARRRRSVVNA